MLPSPAHIPTPLRCLLESPPPKSGVRDCSGTPGPRCDTCRRVKSYSTLAPSSLPTLPSFGLWRPPPSPDQRREHTRVTWYLSAPRTPACRSVPVCFRGRVVSWPLVWLVLFSIQSGVSASAPAPMQPPSPSPHPQEGAVILEVSITALLSLVTAPLFVCPKSPSSKTIGHTWVKYPPEGGQGPRVPPGLPGGAGRRESSQADSPSVGTLGHCC